MVKNNNFYSKNNNIYETKINNLGWFLDFSEAVIMIVAVVVTKLCDSLA